jgi:phosphoribosyl 1,2-cyclic phosphodiesterase
VTLINFDELLMPDGFVVRPFMTYHDALEPCGYKFIEASKSLVYLTDSGYFPQKHYDIIRNADAYILESNHDPEMLLDSDRPWILKKRILDDQGHLSNQDSAQLIMNVIGPNTKVIILAHLSQECNTPEAALSAYQRMFDDQGLIYNDYRILYAEQDRPIKEECL